MKHKYLLYIIVALLVLNTLFLMAYAFRQYRLSENVYAFQKSVPTQLQQMNEDLSKKIDQSDLDQLNTQWNEAITNLQLEINHLNRDEQLASLQERISNIEKVFIQIQVQLNELSTHQTSAQEQIESGTK